MNLTKHFKVEEMTCKCGCGQQKMDPEFMVRLEALRVDYGKPMPITSGFRCPAHNAAESQTGSDGPHTTGKAVDVRVSGGDTHLLLSLALKHGFTGVGVSQRGEHGRRFLHLDCLTSDDGFPRPMVWSY